MVAHIAGENERAVLGLRHDCIGFNACEPREAAAARSERLAVGVKERDAEHLREMDDQFHDIICDMSGHAVISDTLIPLHRKTRRYRKASIADTKRTAQVVKEHRAIFDAIAAGDADRAAALTTEHTIHAKKSMIERMDLHG